MRSTIRLGLVTLGLLGALPAYAQDATTGTPPEKVSSLVVYGDDPCPRSTSDEIVVCGREPESERYRVPKRFRGKKAEPAQQSWSNTVRQLEWVSRAGTPNSCSPVGSGGATGCYQMFMRQARAEREQARQEAADIP
ncbi:MULTISPECIES: hypothetical protein [Sphingomonadales]|uniref:Secreted protein n=1 Tax=Edaphosphingomonas haloaromaticamans TaxID=653954 RepID=A0A1S1HG70_9SPHN|nr:MULTISPECIES: hypothetical protein [Sphingomonas]AGH48572.1 hypothetical protein G432_04225 [Sphingomonas sp. MM-1]MDX3883250.1 hypothetical protein [Sphingomonas sp.]OHT21048.1 hypothetical protein BHE75_03053 [Sphingomonas haloaromaticamans]